MGMFDHCSDGPRDLIPLTITEARQAAHMPGLKLRSIVNNYMLARIYSQTLDLPITSISKKENIEIGPDDFILIGNYKGPKIEYDSPPPTINWWIITSK